MNGIYLDNAATTFPKPESVYERVNEFQRSYAVNAGRGQYKAAKTASDMIADTRKKLAALVNIRSENNVIFSPSATIAMNQVLCGLTYSPETVVYISPFEHNAVVRPLYSLQKQYGFRIELLPFDPATRELNRQAMQNMFALKHPDVVILNHVSNVTGLILPVEEIFAVSRSYGAVNVLDASQSLGMIPVDLDGSRIDFLIFAGHKNLYAHFGVGGFIDNNQIGLKPFIYGGTGSDSLDHEMPDQLPLRYEPASHDVIAIASLNASLDWLDNTGVETVYEQKLRLTEYLIDSLSEIGSIRLYLPADRKNHIAVVSFTQEGYRPEETADILDNDFDIAVRSGFHCAPFVHKLISTEENGGTVRISLGYFNTQNDVDRLKEALIEIEQG